MAYYRWDSAHEPVQPITRQGTGLSGLGAYYAWDSAHEPVQPINGLGGSESQKLADEAAREILSPKYRAGRVSPAFVEWAQQLTDIAWQELPKAGVLSLVPLTSAEIKEVRKRAYGHDLEAVGVTWPGPTRLVDQDRVFEGTPYRRSLSLAVYSAADPSAVPRPYFLTLGALRGPDDPDGGHGLIERQAAPFGGALVYVVSSPRPDGIREPGVNFSEIFRKIGEMGDAASAPATPAQAPSMWKPAVMLIAGATAAGLLWYGIVEKGSRG